MTQIEQIKNKIESLIDKDKHRYYEEYDCAYRDGNNAVCYTLLSFIESLEKEQEKQESSIFTKAEMWVARNYPKTVGEEFDKLVTVYLSGIAEGQRTVDDATKIKGWVARDKSGDLYFFHYDCKPHRTDGIFHSECSEDVFHIDNFLFPEVDWQTEPIEVELTISRVKTE